MFGMKRVMRAVCLLAGAAPLLPSPGQLLVEAAPFGAAIVDRDGAVTRLGTWYETAFSPEGRRLVGVRGNRLAVLDLRGRPTWSIHRSPPRAGMQPDWSADGRRIAYASASGLRVVGARGAADRAVARGLRFAGPRWRPAAPRELAWVDRFGRVRLLDVVSRRTMWRSATAPPVRPEGLRWSPDGKRLAAISGSQVRVFSADGRLVRRVRAERHDHFQTGTYTRDGRLVLVHHNFTRGRSRVTVLAGSERELLVRRGITADVTPSPDGRYLLLGRRTADEWRFLPLDADASTVVVEGVTRRVNPRAGGRWAFPRTRGWAG
jgi:hypothetical protein